MEGAPVLEEAFVREIGINAPSFGDARWIELLEE